MRVLCPECGSVCNLKETAQAIGTTTGIVAGGAGALAGMRGGAQLGMCFGPPGAIIGGIAGTVLGMLFGASVGGTAGAGVGKLVDEHVIGIYECPKCGREVEL